MNWATLWSLISGVNQYATMLGRVWFSLVLIFRLLVFVVAVQQVWRDESNQFVCNTAQPGCRNVCYDKLFPISPERLWALQLVAIICPSLLVTAHVKFRQEKNKKYADANGGGHFYANPGKKRRGLWCTYFASLFFKAAFDITFIVILFLMYGYDMPRLYKCSLEPCPNTVDCYISRSTEKKIFLLFMVVSSVICIVLCICEMAYLLCQCCCTWRKVWSQWKQQYDPTLTDKTPCLRQEPPITLRLQNNDVVQLEKPAVKV